MVNILSNEKATTPYQIPTLHKQYIKQKQMIHSQK